MGVSLRARHTVVQTYCQAIVAPGPDMRSDGAEHLGKL
jgi:hypothetical protein